MEDSLEEQLEKAFEGCVGIPRMERPSKNKVEALKVATKKASVLNSNRSRPKNVSLSFIVEDVYCK